MGSLSKEDFQLYEDGVQQQIAELSRNQLPLSVVLLFDLTASVQPVLKALAAGALEALQHLKPEDEVAIMVYAASAQLLQDFTTDREQAVAAIEKAGTMESSEAAFFNEAIFRRLSNWAKRKIRGAEEPSYGSRTTCRTFLLTGAQRERRVPRRPLKRER